MRALAAYLIVYFALVIGALLALWQSGVLQQLPPVPVVVVLLIAVGLGVLLAFTSRPLRRVEDEHGEEPGST